MLITRGCEGGGGEPKLQVGCKGPLDHIVADAESERYVDLKGMCGGGGGWWGCMSLSYKLIPKALCII